MGTGKTGQQLLVLGEAVRGRGVKGDTGWAVQWVAAELEAEVDRAAALVDYLVGWWGNESCSRDGDDGGFCLVWIDGGMKSENKEEERKEKKEKNGEFVSNGGGREKGGETCNYVDCSN
ncbi:hypothetical protein M0R45_019347 [Rubus argutus]|uniref:Uncharacterized protein n=1 Tax=Rubus argutus TaxID=59490 RepID=A0AAW1X5Y6_RUBAR